MAMEHISETGKHVGDAVSIVTVVGTLAQVLPSIAAIFTIVWTSIRIYETETVQKILGKDKDVKKD
jgi:chromate transport protein ChrA